MQWCNPQWQAVPFYRRSSLPIGLRCLHDSYATLGGKTWQLPGLFSAGQVCKGRTNT